MIPPSASRCARWTASSRLSRPSAPLRRPVWGVFFPAVRAPGALLPGNWAWPSAPAAPDDGSALFKATEMKSPTTARLSGCGLGSPDGAAAPPDSEAGTSIACAPQPPGGGGRTVSSRQGRAHTEAHDIPTRSTGCASVLGKWRTRHLHRPVLLQWGDVLQPGTKPPMSRPAVQQVSPQDGENVAPSDTAAGIARGQDAVSVPARQSRRRQVTRQGRERPARTLQASTGFN